MLFFTSTVCWFVDGAEEFAPLTTGFHSGLLLKDGRDHKNSVMCMSFIPLSCFQQFKIYLHFHTNKNASNYMKYVNRGVISRCKDAECLWNWWQCSTYTTNVNTYKEMKNVNVGEYLLIAWRWGKHTGKTQSLFSLLKNEIIFVEKIIFLYEWNKIENMFGLLKLINTLRKVGQNRKGKNAFLVWR